MKTKRSVTELEAYLDGLPGAHLVRKGLMELSSQELGECGLLVMVAHQRLTEMGLPVPARPDIPRPVEHALYSHLEQTHGNGAYSHYNALLRTLTSFIHALAQRRRQGEEPVAPAALSSLPGRAGPDDRASG